MGQNLHGEWIHVAKQNTNPCNKWRFFSQLWTQQSFCFQSRGTPWHSPISFSRLLPSSIAKDSMYVSRLFSSIPHVPGFQILGVSQIKCISPCCLTSSCRESTNCWLTNSLPWPSDSRTTQSFCNSSRMTILAPVTATSWFPVALDSLSFKTFAWAESCQFSAKINLQYIVLCSTAWPG